MNYCESRIRGQNESLNENLHEIGIVEAIYVRIRKLSTINKMKSL